MTPGRAAYEAWLNAVHPGLGATPYSWEAIPQATRDAWEAAAQAAIDVFLAGDTVSAESIREATAAQERPAPGEAHQCDYCGLMRPPA